MGRPETTTGTTQQSQKEQSSSTTMKHDDKKRGSSGPLPRQNASTNQRETQKQTQQIPTERATSMGDAHSTLIDHSVQLLWSRFFLYFGSELWNIDLPLRFAIILILTGFGCQILISFSYFYWSPRWILLSILLLGPWVYLERNMVLHRFENLLQVLVSPERLARFLGSFEPSTVRTCFLSLLLVPTLFEARTLVFLSHIKAEAGWSLYNVMVALSIFALQYYLWRYRQLRPRDCSQKAIVFLYGSALWITLWRRDMSQLPWLAAPFLTSTGVILWSSRRDGADNQNVLSRVLQQAMRRTLRDVVQHVGTTLHRDEILQLVLWRWLVDYWTKTGTESNGTENTETAENRHTSNLNTPENHTTDSTPSSLSVAAAATNRHDLDWQDMFAMLQITADQMTKEATELKQQHDEPSVSSQTAPPAPSGNQPFGSTTASSSQSHQATPPVVDMDPFQEMKSMLINWDIDEEAKPAVQTIRRGVEAFPPSRQFAIFFSVARRCPGFLAIIYQVGLGQHFCYTSLLILLSLVAFEMLCLHEWILSCHLATVDAEQVDVTQQNLEFDHADVLQNLDTMIILLSDDLYRRDHPSSLLRVWWNLEDCVSALESGLVTARCVQSTAVAADFAENIMSLARFGREVHERGWVHGLMVAAQDIYALHTQDASLGPTAGYVHAALGAYYNGHRLYKNASAFAEEGQLESFVLPLLGIVPIMIGHGWLWAQTSSPGDPSKSTVTIEEIFEEERTRDISTPTDTHQVGEMASTSLRDSPLLTKEYGFDVSDAEISAKSQKEKKKEALESEEGMGSELLEATILEEQDVPGNLESIPQSIVSDDAETMRDIGRSRTTVRTHSEILLDRRSQLMDLISKCQESKLLDEVSIAVGLIQIDRFNALIYFVS